MWLQDFYKYMREDVVAQAIASLTLGFTLARELGHAAFVAGNKPSVCQKSEWFCFDADRKNQGYHMLQSLAFGGNLRKEQDLTHQSYYTVDGAKGVPGLWLALCDYPSASFSQTYTYYPGWAENYGELITCHHREWQVPFWWALKMMNDDVWETGAVEKGRKALRAPREVGFIMKRNMHTKWGPFHASMKIPEGLVPSGFKMVPRSYHIVADSLWNEFAGNLLYHGPDSDLESCSEKVIAASFGELPMGFVDSKSDTHSDDGMKYDCECSGIPVEDSGDDANAWSDDDEPIVWTVSRNEGGFYDNRGTFSDEMLLAAHEVASDGSLDESWADTSSENDHASDLERMAEEVDNEAPDDGYYWEELVAAEGTDEEMSDDDGYHSEVLIEATDEQRGAELPNEEDSLDDLDRIANVEADSDSESGDTPMDGDDLNGVTNGEKVRRLESKIPVRTARRFPNRANVHK